MHLVKATEANNFGMRSAKNVDDKSSREETQRAVKTPGRPGGLCW